MEKLSGIRPISADELNWISGGQDGPYAPTIVNNSANSSLSSKVGSAISIIATNYDSLTQLAKDSADNIEHVVIDPASNGRSYVDYDTNTLHLNADEVANANAGFIAGNIVHDGDHVYQQEQGGGYNGVQSEKDATQLEIDNAQALQITDSDKAYLEKYRDDQNDQIEKRMAEPVNTNDDEDADETAPDPSDPDGYQDYTDMTDDGYSDGGDSDGDAMPDVDYAPGDLSGWNGGGGSAGVSS